MSRRLPFVFGGNTTRCCINTLLLITILMLAFSSTAQAQSHAVTIGKDCLDTNVTTCFDDDSCFVEQCTTSRCVQGDRSATCTVTLTNADGWNDIVRVDSARDLVHAGGGDHAVPGGADHDRDVTIGPDLPIIFISEFASCAGGAVPTAVLPCDLGPPGDDAAGYVTFEADYLLTEADEVNTDGDRIGNLATIGITDVCDGINSHNDPYGGHDLGHTNTTGCDDTADLPQTKTASTPTRSGCVHVPTVCDPDNNLCTEDFLCDTGTGLCPPPGPPTVCDPDDNACTEDFLCDTSSGLCPPPGPPTVCDDATCQLCDTSSGSCVDKPELPDVCLAVEICRTPGFWATHAGVEKGTKSQNITQEVIEAATDGLKVCGVTIDNTSDLDWDPDWNLPVYRNKSSTEAMCVSVKGDSNRQLVRQLTAFALNCVMSGGDGDCTGLGFYLGDLANECNTVCVDGEDGGRTVNDCIGEIDAFNNGLLWGPSGPHLGWCSTETEKACSENTDCTGTISGQTCVIEEDSSCHDRELCQAAEEGLCFLKPGPAGSSNACKIAKKNDIYVADEFYGDN
jgi:hypothetical protein